MSPSKILLAVCAVSLSACTTLDQSVAFDASTTYYGLSTSAHIAEANPLLGQVDHAGATALLTIPLSYGIAHAIKANTLKPDCSLYVGHLTAVKFGAGVNNLALVAGATGWTPLGLGIATWFFSSRARGVKEDAQSFCGYKPLRGVAALHPR